MRKPIIKNKYNLNIKDLKRLKVKNSSQITSPLFWRNDVINAWCISQSTNIKKFNKDDFAEWADVDLINSSVQNSYWICIYDDDAKAYAGKIRITFDSYDGMASYKFNKFYNKEDIENEQDLLIQEMFLKKINYLLDNGIIELI